MQCFTGVDVTIARGISISNDTIPIIGVNNEDRYPAKTFSIIHELVHILKRQSTLCNEMIDSLYSREEEMFCNAVTGEVLVPADALSGYLSRKNIASMSLDHVETMSKKFSISKEVVIRRLLDTKRIIQDEYDNLTNEIHQNFLKEQERKKLLRQNGDGQRIPRNINREAVDKTSPTICRILLTGYSDGYFSKQDVSGFLGINEKYIPQFFNDVMKQMII